MKRCLIGFLPEFYNSVSNYKDYFSCSFEDYTRDYLVENISGFSVIVPHLKIKLDKDILSLAHNLEVIATPSTGLDHIDLAYCEANNIAVLCLHDDRQFIDNVSSTSEFAWLLIMGCIRNIRFAIDRVKYDKSWVNIDIRGHEIKGKTIGIIGYGRLGKHLASYAKGFNCKVIAYDVLDSVFSTEDVNVKKVDFDYLLSHSDVISLHTTLNSSSYHLINSQSISKMKDGVVLVNTSRGAIMDSQAVLEAVTNGKIKSVGIDVASEEMQSGFLPNDCLINASITNKNIIVTPHVGGATYDAHDQVFLKTLQSLIESNYDK